MPTIKIDGVAYEVEAGENLLQTCLNLGLDLPYFCWHPAMGSVGACRQCALVQYQREEDQHGRIVMGCMTPVTDGAVFSLKGPDAQEFRNAVVESLMLNHPHDCPVCAEGGECHLQDMTVMVGHRDRHYRGRKNTHRNQYLGPLIHHEMNRCITCYRCTRYYRDYAGGTDLAAMAAHDHIYFGRDREGILQSEFAGNLVEVCPTGVFTDKSLVHDYTRKWDLQSAPSVCTSCGLGCNTLPGERYGKLKRIHNRFNREVNGYFLCDRGRFGGTHVNSDKRLDYPGLRTADNSFTALDEKAATEQAISACSDQRLAAIGSPRASLEANFLLRQLVGADNFCNGMGNSEAQLLQRITRHLANSRAENPSLHRVESADAVLILGEDVTHTAPRLALSLRQSVRNRGFQLAEDMQLQRWQDAAVRNLAQEQRSPLHSVTFGSTGLDDIAASSTSLPLDGQELFAQELLAALTGEAIGNELVERIAQDLRNATQPLVVCGSSSASAALVDSARAIADCLHSEERPAMLSYCVPECNSLGSALLTLGGNQSLEGLAERAIAGEIDTLLVLENDLFRRAGSTTVAELLGNVPCIIGIDCLETETLEHCHLVLPAASFSECEGTLVSSEARAQRYFPVHQPAAGRRANWQWLLDLAATGADPVLADLNHFDEVNAYCAQQIPALAAIQEAAPDHTFRNQGLKVPRQPHRYSGRTAMRANVSVHEPKQSVDDESALAFTMEGNSHTPPGALLPFVWAPGWNSNQALHKFQSEVGGPLIGGTAGVRLLDRTGDIAEAADPEKSIAPSPQPGEYRLHPRYRIFGSEELSVHSPGIAELAGPAWVALCGADARSLDLAEGDGASVGGRSLELKIDDSIPTGCMAYSAGFSGTGDLQPGLCLPVTKALDWQRQPELIASEGGPGHD
jgi:NADH-quinone oxidoreductase subunit G